MPITQSAKKALRQSKKRNHENLKFKRKFKSAIKDFRKEIGAKSIEKAKSLLLKVQADIFSFLPFQCFPWLRGPTLQPPWDHTSPFELLAVFWQSCSNQAFLLLLF